SVFPKAACWAFASAMIAVLVKLLVFSWHDTEYMNGINDIWSGYSFVLGFVMVFRNNQAYSRFWEGTSLTKQMKGQWFVAFSGLFAFCSRDESKQADVAHFQSVLVRLGSLLHCSALQKICDLEDNSLEIINSDEMDPISMEFLRTCTNPQEVVTNWIQRLIVQATDENTIDISAPLLSRVFQELGTGVISLNNAGKIKDFQFPFPYAQMITCMLFVHFLFTPIIAAHQIGSAPWAGAMSFCVTISFWSLFYIAAEIDQPFGEDDNDLPIHKMQQEWNNSLLTLLLPCSQVVPTFEISHSRGGSSFGRTQTMDEEPVVEPLLFRQHTHRRTSSKDHFRTTTLGESATLFADLFDNMSGPIQLSIDEGCVSSRDSLGDSVITATNMEMQENSETGAVSVRLSSKPSSRADFSDVNGVKALSAPMKLTINGDCVSQQDSEGVSVITATNMDMQEDSESGAVSVRFTSDPRSHDRWDRNSSDGTKSAPVRL
ncbi:unnamed protein product, partial [Polarella glacialis]